MQRRKIAVIAAAALLGAELVEAADTFDLRSVAADAPHNHIEMPEGTSITVTNSLFASGGQAARVDYYVQLAPAYATDPEGNQVVVGYHVYGLPDFGTQQMYVRYETLDALVSSLSSALGLGPPQLEATRQSLLSGQRTEIGGHGGRLYWPERLMRDLGLKFGMLET
jgi:hypothetical protein